MWRAFTWRCYRGITRLNEESRGFGLPKTIELKGMYDALVWTMQGRYSNPYLSLAKYLAKSLTWLSTLLKSYSNAKMKLCLNLAKIDDVVRK